MCNRKSKEQLSCQQHLPQPLQSNERSPAAPAEQGDERPAPHWTSISPGSLQGENIKAKGQ